MWVGTFGARFWTVMILVNVAISFTPSYGIVPPKISHIIPFLVEFRTDTIKINNIYKKK